MLTKTQILHFFFFNDTATTEIYTLSLHDALPIFIRLLRRQLHWAVVVDQKNAVLLQSEVEGHRSEEHTSELQSPCNLVCRLLLEKKKKLIVLHVRRIHPVINRIGIVINAIALHRA